MLNVEENKDFVKIEYTSQHFRQLSFLIALAVLVPLAGLLFYINKEYITPPRFWFYVFLFYVGAGIALLFLSGYEKKLEIHRERIYTKAYPIKGENTVKTDGLVRVIFENNPDVKFYFPIEIWSVSLEFEPDENEEEKKEEDEDSDEDDEDEEGNPNVVLLVSEINDHRACRRIADEISSRLNVPLLDKTYADQCEVEMEYEPGTYSMSFAERVVKFQELIVTGELPLDKLIFEDIVSNSRKIFKWTGLSKGSFFRTLAWGLLFVVLTAIGVIGAKESFITLPWIADNRPVYYTIIIIILGRIALLTGIRNKLTLDVDFITFNRISSGFILENTKLETATVGEVRIKPSPGGFVLIIAGRDDCIEIRTNAGGIKDFGQLLWLTSRVQDFILANRNSLGEKVEEDEEKE